MSQKSGPRPKNALPAPPKPKQSTSGSDVVLIQGVTEAGDVAVLRARDDRVEAGVVRPIQEGEPLSGEVVKLKPRKDMPLVCDVEVQVASDAVNALGGSDRGPGHKGPARVATKAYRQNWDSIWQKPRSSKRDKDKLN